MTKLRWGVISTSNIGRAAVNPAIQASNNGELMAVASRDGERAREFAEKWDIPAHYGSYEALLDDDSLDAVYIPLPNSMHREWTVRAAEKGKRVLCEKPLALNEAECGEMRAAADANGVKLMEAFMYRFHPRIQRVVEMVRAGAVGDLKVITSAFTFRLKNPDNIRLDPDLGGGSLMDVGCYCVNVSRTIAGAEPVEVQAVAHQSASGVDEQMAGTLRFEDGLLAQFDCALAIGAHNEIESAVAAVRQRHVRSVWPRLEARHSLADARRAEEDDVLITGQEAELVERVDLLVLDRGLEAEVEVVEGLDGREPARAHGSLKAPMIAQHDLSTEELLDGF